MTEYIKIDPLNRPDYRSLIAHVSGLVWPEFMRQSPVSAQYWDDLFERFPEYQFAFLDPGNDKVIGLANSVPLAWNNPAADLPDDGWDWALIQSVDDHKAGREAKTLCGIQISVTPAYQGQGMSSRLLGLMKAVGQAAGFKSVIVPVRPSLKSRYPLTPIDDYIHWRNDEGWPFDPWLRVHVRGGGKIIKACHQAMLIEGSVAEWEAWTEMPFPDSGPYIIPGALTPVVINRDMDLGRYIEPNVWVEHQINENETHKP